VLIVHNVAEDEYFESVYKDGCAREQILHVPQYLRLSIVFPLSLVHLHHLQELLVILWIVGESQPDLCDIVLDGVIVRLTGYLLSGNSWTSRDVLLSRARRSERGWELEGFNFVWVFIEVQGLGTVRRGEVNDTSLFGVVHILAIREESVEA